VKGPGGGGAGQRKGHINPSMHEIDHSTNPTKPNKTAKTILPTTNFILPSPPRPILIPPDDEFPPFAPAVEVLVDADVAPVAVPDAEEDVLELVEKVATGREETVFQVPPLIVVFGS